MLVENTEVLMAEQQIEKCLHEDLRGWQRKPLLIPQRQLDEFTRQSVFKALPDYTVIIQTKWPSISLYLMPYYVPVDKQLRSDIGWELNQRLKDNPDETFLEIAYLPRDSTLQAMLIAYVEEKRVWIWQARSMRGFKYQKVMLGGLIEWARTKGIEQIRCKVSKERNRKLYERKYGFKSKRNKELYLNVA